MIEMSFKFECHFEFHFRNKKSRQMPKIGISAPKRAQNSSKVKVAIRVKKG